ncbi:MAG: PQQ-dependent sugar dehydrogenase [Acidimicrobiales bacterium]
MTRRIGSLLVAGVLVASACSGSADDTSSPITAPSTTGANRSTTTTAELAEPKLSSIDLDTVEVADLKSPTAMAARSSTSDLYVTQQSGQVRLIKVTTSTSSSTPPRYTLQTMPVLDLSEEVLSGGERGLLGLAFSSDGRKLYVDFTAKPDGRTMIVEYELGDRTTVDTKSRRVLLEVEQPAANHNGGQLVVGPDGYLYIGLGDGGGQGDPQGNGQDRDALLGSILRIDPEGAPASRSREYGIPAGNPFADGEDGAPEVWLYGVRNPWRFSFDADTGDLWIGDVGQNAWEEIDRLPSTNGFDAGRGANLGWDRVEGSHPFEGDNPPGGVLPAFEYSHDDGCSVIGGYVYRGQVIEELRGVYLFADHCAPGLRGLQLDGGAIVDQRTWPLDADGVYSLGQDNAGEVFVLLKTGPMLKIVEPTASDN